MDSFQMALSDFSDVVFWFWFQLCAFFVRIVDILVNVKWPSVIFQPAHDVLCP